MRRSALTGSSLVIGLIGRGVEGERLIYIGPVSARRAAGDALGNGNYVAISGFLRVGDGNLYRLFHVYGLFGVWSCFAYRVCYVCV